MSKWPRTRSPRRSTTPSNRAGIPRRTDTGPRPPTPAASTHRRAPRSSDRHDVSAADRATGPAPAMALGRRPVGRGGTGRMAVVTGRPGLAGVRGAGYPRVVVSVFRPLAPRVFAGRDDARSDLAGQRCRALGLD